MGHYFEGLMRQTGLKFGPSSSAVDRHGERAAQPIPPLDSERRVLVDPVVPVGSESAESPSSPPGELDATGRAEAGFEPQAPRAEELDQDVAVTPRVSGPLEPPQSAPLHEKATHGREIEVDSINTPFTPESMEEGSPTPRQTRDTQTGDSDVLQIDQEVDKTEAHQPLLARQQDEESISTPTPERVESARVDKGEQSIARPNPHTHPEPSPGQDVVRQVLEWIGEEESRPKDAIHTEPAEPISQNLLGQERSIEQPVSVVTQDSVVEQQQSLQLSIGSIVMTVEGPPSNVEVQPGRPRDPHPTPAPASEPPVRLSRHYLRLR